MFMHGNTFTFENWKKTHRLTKHTKSSRHQQAMIKWIDYREQARRKHSMLGQLNTAHKQQVARNREYLKIIIETLLFTAKQNIAQRGHEEDRSSLDEESDINRGNFLELLHLRSKDIPWLAEKMQSQLDAHMQWTSPRIQNEILNIMSDVVLESISKDVKKSPGYSIIVDETSDISRVEQVAICLRYIIEGETKESFIGFYDTPSTEGEVLCKLVKDVLEKLKLKLDDIVGLCFDGAANMSGIHKGLATRMKQCSPLSIYVHCYGHLLNLAIQDTMTNIEPLRNALGIIQSLYNFIEASPKRHAIFENIAIDKKQTRTLKSQSLTRWSCRYEAVKSVIEQLPDIVKTLLHLANDQDPKTYTDGTALLKAISDFDFLVGLVILKLILSNTNGLNKYLQGKTVDVITARKTASATLETLANCRNEDNFETVWVMVEMLGQRIQKVIENTPFSFKEARAPRKKMVPHRLQALVGDSTREVPLNLSAKVGHRISTFYPSLDRVIAVIESRFAGNDQDILCALGHVILDRDMPIQDEFYQVVSSHYSLDLDILKAEKQIYLNFVKNRTHQQETTASGIVQNLYQNDLHGVLPVFNRVASILAAIPVSSCSAERSFSSLRRMKTYLRSTMDQTRLNSLALLNIERKYTNKTVSENIDNIINIFGTKINDRTKYLF